MIESFATSGSFRTASVTLKEKKEEAEVLIPEKEPQEEVLSYSPTDLFCERLFEIWEKAAKSAKVPSETRSVSRRLVRVQEPVDQPFFVNIYCTKEGLAVSVETKKQNAKSIKQAISFSIRSLENFYISNNKATFKDPSLESAEKSLVEVLDKVKEHPLARKLMDSIGERSLNDEFCRIYFRLAEWQTSKEKAINVLIMHEMFFAATNKLLNAKVLRLEDLYTLSFMSVRNLKEKLKKRLPVKNERDAEKILKFFDKMAGVPFLEIVEQNLEFLTRLKKNNELESGEPAATPIPVTQSGLHTLKLVSRNRDLLAHFEKIGDAEHQIKQMDNWLINFSYDPKQRKKTTFAQNAISHENLELSIKFWTQLKQDVLEMGFKNECGIFSFKYKAKSFDAVKEIFEFLSLPLIARFVAIVGRGQRLAFAKLAGKQSVEKIFYSIGLPDDLNASNNSGELAKIIKKRPYEVHFRIETDFPKITLLYKSLESLRPHLAALKNCENELPKYVFNESLNLDFFIKVGNSGRLYAVIQSGLLSLSKRLAFFAPAKLQEYYKKFHDSQQNYLAGDDWDVSSIIQLFQDYESGPSDVREQLKLDAKLCRSVKDTKKKEERAMAKVNPPEVKDRLNWLGEN